MSIKRQKGLSIQSVLVAILIFGITMMIGVKAVPLYLDDYAVAEVVASLKNRPDIKSARAPDVRDWLKKGLSTNRIELAKSEIKVFSDHNSGVTVEIDYERRFHVFHNIDLVLIFEHDWNAESQ